MNDFIFITTNVILPLFIPVVLGYILSKLIEVDVKTLSALQFYILIPALIYIKIMETQIDAEVFYLIVIHCLILYFLLYGITYLFARLRGYDKGTTMAMINSVSLYNSGNYGLPLIEVLYQGNPLAMTVQIFIMLMQNILTNTLGIFTASCGTMPIKKAFLQMLKIPIIYVMIITAIMRSFNLTLPGSVQYYINILSNALVPVALITLGVSLAKIRFDLRDIKMHIINILRLIISPIIAYAIVKMLGLAGIVGQVLVIISACPVAVNAMMLAVQYNNKPDLVSKSILTSTLLSSITVSTVIYFALKFI